MIILLVKEGPKTFIQLPVIQLKNCKYLNQKLDAFLGLSWPFYLFDLSICFIKGWDSNPG